MAQTIRFFRDTLSVDPVAISALQASPGDTLVLAGRQVTLIALAPEYDFVIAVDRLIVAPHAGTTLTGVAGNPSPSITVLARSIEGSPLAVTAGMLGVNGADGAAGESGIEPSDHGGDPSSCREEMAGTVVTAVMAAPAAPSRFATPRLPRSSLEVLTAARAGAPARAEPAERDDRLEKRKRRHPRKVGGIRSRCYYASGRRRSLEAARRCFGPAMGGIPRGSRRFLLS